MYPNPVTGNKLFLELPIADETQISVAIYGSNGQLYGSLSKLYSDGEILDVDVSNYPSGVYFIRINSEQYQEQLRFIKN